MGTLITCHANADCDALAAMLAARHLYESPTLFFPGTQETNLAKVFSTIDKEKYNLADPQVLDWNSFERVVVVDTRQKGRVKHIDPLLKKGGIEIETWDHHPASRDDLSATREHIFKTGSITSALCKELESRGVKIDAEEATLLGLGIYADTGSFTYSSTTVADFSAAGWLLGQGMNVHTITDMASHELTSAQVHALNSLLESAKTYMIGGNPVVLAEVSLDHYMGDFAYLTHKLVEMEKFPVIFALGIMEDHIQVVARSRNDSINVGEVCVELGGGGHGYAASAAVRAKTITEVREIILRRLSEKVGPEKHAADYMSVPPIGIEATASLKEADELMLHFGLKAVPVFQPGTRACAGMLDAQMAARATSHGLGEEKVEEYMQRRISTLPPDATLREVTEIIVGERQRLVPIVEKGNVIGVLTRTDIINVFASESGNLAPRSGNSESRMRNVAKLINDRLPAETRRILALAGELGRRLRLPVYAVGGFARDLLLGYPNHDIDLVAEGNGIALARELARELGGRVREHEKFLTSVVIYHDDSGVERHIDVATARLEYYEYPAALPTVELSSIKMDLFRRDFSINALAIRLDCEPAGQLADFFGAHRDIKDKRIRVLHTLSFVEDPTRCIRAVRFEQRYKFKIGPGTEKLIKNILPMHLLEKLSPHRLFNEFRLICEEDSAAECLARLDEIGILKSLSPYLALTPEKSMALKRTKNVIPMARILFSEEKFQPWICWYYSLCHNQNYAAASENYRALGLPQNRKAEILKQREEIRKLKPKLTAWQKAYTRGTAKISQLYELLCNISLEGLVYCMANVKDSELEKNISQFITRWRHEKADINGNDLLKLGLVPGPDFGHLLRQTLLAKLDGRAPNAARQLTFVKSILRERVRQETDSA